MKALDGIRKSMRTWTIQKCEENGEYWEDVEGPDTGMHNGRIAKVKVTDVPADKLLRALEVADKTIDLVLYYVEGDATYEGVKLKVDEACAKYTAFIKEGGE